MAPADTAPPLLPWHFPAACAALQRSWALQARPPHAPPSDSLRPAAARIAHIPGDIIEWRLQRDPAMPGGAVLAASKRVSLGCTEGLARRISERSSPGPHPSAELDPDVDSPATFASCVDDSSRLGTSEAMATSCGERHPTDAFLLGEGDPAAAIEEHVERSSGSAVLRLWVSYSETYMCPELCFSVIAVRIRESPPYRCEHVLPYQCGHVLPSRLNTCLRFSTLSVCMA